MTKSSIRGLGEVNLWAKDIARMREFYVDVLGLTPIHESKRHIFLKVADGYEGHPQVVALFNSRFAGVRVKPDITRTTLNHLAFEIPLAEFSHERRRLRRMGLDIDEELHREPHWRSLYFNDPEGNQIEFVAYDRSVH